MILTRLREHTREAHQRLEAQVNILESASSFPAYIHLLTQFYGFYVPVEAKLAAWPDWEQLDFDLCARRKTTLLRQDLLALGYAPAAVEKLPLCPRVPQCASFGGALGCLYVLEGSTLGGQIISRHLKATLGLDAGNGATFFNSYGSDIGRMWRAFGEMLTQYAATRDEDAAILQGASDTFAALEAWIGKETTTR